MKKAKKVWIRCTGLAIGVIWTFGVGYAFEGETHKRVDGMDIYIGMIPGEPEWIRQLPRQEKLKVGRLPGMHQYHLVVDLYDSGTGKRITGAEVAAEITGGGTGETTRILNRLRDNEILNSRYWFSLPKGSVYRVLLRLQIPEKEQTEVLFEMGDGAR